MGVPSESSRDETMTSLGSPLLPPSKGSTREEEEEAPESDLEMLCMDDMLQKYCGEFGSWQLRQFVLTSMAWALEALHTMVMIFADQERDWRCVNGSGSWWDESAKSVCELEPGSWEWIGGPESSTVAQWGLVCGEKYKIGLVQGLFFVGCMIGAGIFGHLSDSKLGRKGSLTVACILNIIFGCLTEVAPDYLTYLLLRLLTGFGTGGVGLCAFVLATETVGPTKRGAAGISTFYFFPVGVALLSGIAYVYPSWRDLYLASSFPSFLFLFVIPLITESPRWYLVRGKMDSAMILMRIIAKSNRRHLPNGVTLALDDEVNKTSTCKVATATKEAKTGSIIDVVRSPITRIRLLLAVAINFLCSVVFYGLSLNVVNLETNLYLNVLLNAVAEIPAVTITAVLLDKFGREPLAVGTQWFGGIFCLVGCIVGNVGIWKVLRMICGILGIFGMAGGILAYYLPETLNRPLYDTMTRMEQGESVGISVWK